MVLPVGQHDHDTGSFTLIVKSAPTRFYRTSNGRALQRHHARVHRFQEQPQGVYVGGQGTLHVSVARKHHKPHAVARGGGCEAFHGAFGQIQSGQAHVLRHHAVAHVQCHHHVDSFGFDLLEPAAHFGIEPSHHECRKGHAHEQKLPRRDEDAVPREDTVDAAGVGQHLDGLVAPTQEACHGHRQHGRQGKHGHKFSLVQGEAGYERLGGQPPRHHRDPEQELEEHQHANGGSKGRPSLHSATDFMKVNRKKHSSVSPNMARTIHGKDASDFRWYLNTLNSVFSSASISR